MTVTYNPAQLTDEQNRWFVQGTRRGSRRVIALRLNQIFNFPGGYRAAYRAVKTGYQACDLYAGPLDGGQGYGINCR